MGVKALLSCGVAASFLALAAVAAAPAKATEAREQLREQFDKALKGKTVAWAPVWLGVLESEWTRVMKNHFDDYGVKLEVRDANFKSDVQLQAVSTFINEKPDVLIVQNPNVTLLARELKRAMDAGIFVIQVNMASNTLTDAYVGVDAKDLGRKLARSIIGDCGAGKGSGEVSILEGEATAAYSLDMKNGAMEVFKAEPSIKVVSSQPTSWDANKAGEITATVLQQHPNLCAVLSVWGPQAAGAAQAIKAAGKSGQAKIYVASDGQPADCDLLEQGAFYRNLSYRADTQGEAIVNAVLALLQSGDKPGAKRIAYYTTPAWVNGKDDRMYCFTVPKDAK
ncbi:MAG: sugar ABC transporter substrate-binding protein [Pseudomonadota bacterium]|nr:sugar ABC transporter substrate-binding protein [Pseudomonadota bacterium]